MLPSDMPSGQGNDDDSDHDRDRRHFQGIDKGNVIADDDDDGGLKGKGEGVAVDDYGGDDDGYRDRTGKAEVVAIDDGDGGLKEKGKEVAVDDYGEGDDGIDRKGKRSRESTGGTPDIPDYWKEIIEEDSEIRVREFEWRGYSYDPSELFSSKPSMYMESFLTFEEDKMKDGEWQLAPNQAPEQFQSAYDPCEFKAPDMLNEYTSYAAKPSICKESLPTFEEDKMKDGEWQLAPNQTPEQFQSAYDPCEFKAPDMLKQYTSYAAKPSICKESLPTFEEDKMKDGEWQLAPNQTPEQFQSAYDPCEFTLWSSEEQQTEHSNRESSFQPSVQQLPSNLSNMVGFEMPQSYESQLSGHSVDIVGAERGEQIQSTYLRSGGISLYGHSQHIEHLNPQSTFQPYHQQMLSYLSNNVGFNIPQSQDLQLSGHLVGAVGTKRGEQFQSTYLRSCSHQQLSLSVSDTVAFEIPESRDSQLQRHLVDVFGAMRGEQLQSTYLRSQGTPLVGHEQHHVHGRPRLQPGQEHSFSYSSTTQASHVAQRPGRLRQFAGQNFIATRQSDTWMELCNEWFRRYWRREDQLCAIQRQRRFGEQWNLGPSRPAVQPGQSQNFVFPKWMILGFPPQLMVSPQSAQAARSRAQLHTMQPSWSVGQQNLGLSRSMQFDQVQSFLPPSSSFPACLQQPLVSPHSELASRGLSQGDRLQAMPSRKQYDLKPLPPSLQIGQLESFTSRHQQQPMVSPGSEQATWGLCHGDQLQEFNPRRLLMMMSPGSEQATWGLSHGNQLQAIQSISSGEQHNLKPLPPSLQPGEVELFVSPTSLFSGHLQRLTDSQRAELSLSHGNQLHTMQSLSGEQQNLEPSPPTMQAVQVEESLSFISGNLPQLSPGSGEEGGPLLSSVQQNLDVWPATGTEQQYEDRDEQK